MCPITPRFRGARRSWVRSLLPRQAEDAVAHLDRQQRSRCPRRPAAQSTKEQDYRKLHLCVDEQTGEVVAGELTSKRARDHRGLHRLSDRSTVPSHRPELTPHTTPAASMRRFENHSAHRSPRVLIPPRKGAQLASGPASSRQRNRNIAAQARLGKRKWHTESGCVPRSVEKERRPPLRHQSIRSGGNLRVFENLLRRW